MERREEGEISGSSSNRNGSRHREMLEPSDEIASSPQQHPKPDILSAIDNNEEEMEQSNDDDESGEGSQGEVCPKCQKILPNIDLLLQHVKEHGRNRKKET